MSLVTSPLRYPGGKSRALKQIALAGVDDFEEFREPFLGGGSVYLYYRQHYPQASYWVNDKYRDLYLFWRQAQQDLPELVNQVKKWKKRFAADGKGFYQFLNSKQGQMTDLERAAAFFCYNRMTFSGTTLSGGFSQSAYEGRFTPSSIERLEKLDGLLSGTKITGQDFAPLIKKEGQGVFIFLDPPYYSAEGSKLYGKDGDMHTGFDHQTLAQLLSVCPHRFLITYDDSDYIRDLYKDWANIQSWTLKYGMRNVGKVNQDGQELFISNY